MRKKRPKIKKSKHVSRKKKAVRKSKRITEKIYSRNFISKRAFGHEHYDKVHGSNLIDMVDYNRDAPLFSFIAPAIRDYMYEDYYKNVYSRDIPFEIVFVGHKPPLKKMPDNFRYIETDVKPSQCYEIAARQSKGEFLILTGDDCRYNANFLGKMLLRCQGMDMDSNFIIFRHYQSSGKKIRVDGPVVNGRKWYNSVAHLIKKDVWDKIGGFDRRYWGLGMCIDQQLRLHKLGFEVVIVDECVAMEVENSVIMGETGIVRCSIRDSEIRSKSGDDWDPWIKKNSVWDRIPFLPFVDKDILTVSQGE